MPSISLGYGSSENLSVASPALGGHFIPAMDDSGFSDGFGLIAPWGGAQLQRATPSAEDISSSISDALSGRDARGNLTQDAIDDFADYLSGLSFEPMRLEVSQVDFGSLLTGLAGLQGPVTPKKFELSVPAVSNDLISALKGIVPKDAKSNIYYNLNQGITILENRTFDPPDPETGRIWLRTDL